MTELQPVLHKPIPMGTRVVVPDRFCGEERRGKVVGVAATTVAFWYIVLLDEPFDGPFGETQALSVNGCELTGEDGSHWRIDDDRAIHVRVRQAPP